MSDYGFSIVFGRPLPLEFTNWFCRYLQPIQGVSWHEAQSLHATVVNCTLPRGRSEKSKDSVLLSKDELKKKFIDHVVEILSDSKILEIKFKKVQCAGSSIILPSHDDARIGQLKRALQGDRDFILEDEAPTVLALPNVVGRDKFSGDQKALQPSVSVTLGKSNARDLIASLEIPQTPGVKVTGLRVVFYRDRNLDDAEVSDLLRFGASKSTKKTNVRKIVEFFERL